MATVKNRSTLGVRYLDIATQKEKTFNIGYVNPDNSDATNKLFAEKVFSLSEAGSINQIYTTDIVNITDASTDTTTFSITGVNISNDFFSTDSDTWQAYVATLSSNAHLDFSGKIYKTVDGEIQEVAYSEFKIDISDLQQYKSSNPYEGLANYSYATLAKWIDSQFVDATGNKIIAYKFIDGVGSFEALPNSGMTGFDVRIEGTSTLLKAFYESADEATKAMFINAGSTTINFYTSAGTIE